GALPETLALDVMEQAAHGLAVIHRMGLVHRDIKAREGALPETLALDVMEQAAHGLAVIHRMGLVHRDI
ncbi:hypothetical protein HT105_25515, partial [Bacteroides fragilis]|nr:hypothetical protein [Bacteroides fragilis]